MESFNTIIKKNITEKLKKISKPFLLLIIAILVLVSPLLTNKIIFGHDYIFHATNNILTNSYIDIFNFKFSLPKIFGDTIANGFGYGTGIFYPPLSYYATSYISYFLNLSSNNTLLSLTYLEILIIILSGITMYIFIKRISKEDYIAMISSISYIGSTYFLCNIYTRSALAEALTSIFIPIIFLGLYELFFGDDKKFTLLFTIGYVGMLNSHLVLSIFLTIIIIIIFLIHYKKVFKKDKLIKLIKSSILILLISSPYLIGLLEHKFCGNYTVFEENTMYTIEILKENALSITDFFIIRFKTDDGLEVYMNYMTLISAITTILWRKKIFNKENTSIYKISMLIVVISATMSTKYFPWAYMPSFIKMIQFPWRLCGLTSFGLAILAGYVIKTVPKTQQKSLAYLMSIFIIIFSYSTIARENIHDIVIPNQMNMGVQQEYLPSKTQSNIDYFNNRSQELIIKEGEGNIELIENNTPYLKSSITIKSDTITIELPRLYYLGYKITLKDSEDKETKINYYENEYGFIELELNQSGILEIDYKGTTANKIANYTCLVTIIGWIIVSIYKRKINRL